ncbi:MAG: biotin transporter BioY [Melioribacteraceae bacterium]
MNSLQNVASKSSFLEKSLSSTAFWVITFSVLTFLSAQVAVPVQPVPFTLQTLLVVLSGAFLGSKNGAASQALYLLVGAIGIPVFAAFTGGFVKFFGPTGGYLLSFPFAAFLTGYIIEKFNTKFAVIAAIVLANVLILVVGSLYLSVFFGGNISQSFMSGLLIFSIWDVIKISAAISIYFSLRAKYPRLPKK